MILPAPKSNTTAHDFLFEVPADEGTLRERLRDAFDEGTSNFGTGFWAPGEQNAIFDKVMPVVATELQKARADAWDDGARRVVEHNRSARLVMPTDNPFRSQEPPTEQEQP